jgi:hypothetical protein
LGALFPSFPSLSKEGPLRNQENAAWPPLNAQTVVAKFEKIGALRGSLVTTPSAPIKGGFAAFV